MNGDDLARHVCDPQVPGDLILGVRRDEKYGAEALLEIGRSSGLPGLESVREERRLHEIGGEPDLESATLEVAGGYDFRLLHVPEGDEQIAAGSLIQLFMGLASGPPARGGPPSVIAQPNRVLGFDGDGGAATLTADHKRYLNELGVVRPAASASYPRVRVVDSGCTGPQNMVLRRNLLDPGRSDDVDDDDGHGSLVAAIIDEIARSPFEVFKVAGARRDATEWEVLQALSLSPVPPIINLSMSLSFGRPYCTQCGRRPVGARTSVFQERLRELEEAGAIVVVAAGNQGAAQLAYPSRFASAVAVEACAGQPPRVTGYSNFGAIDERGNAHASVFVCPGGDSGGLEGPAFRRSGSVAYGTSYAAAYMSGILAAMWAELSGCTEPCVCCRERVLAHARCVASTSFLDYDRDLHGNGLARFR